MAAPIKTSDVREEYVCELDRFNTNPPDERACCRYAECKQRTKIISLPRECHDFSHLCVSLALAICLSLSHTHTLPSPPFLLQNASDAILHLVLVDGHVNDGMVGTLAFQ